MKEDVDNIGTISILKSLYLKKKGIQRIFNNSTFDNLIRQIACKINLSFLWLKQFRWHDVAMLLQSVVVKTHAVKIKSEKVGKYLEFSAD